jgi:hypothetical protein
MKEMIKPIIVILLVLGMIGGCIYKCGQHDENRFTKDFGVSWPNSDSDAAAKSPVIEKRLALENDKIGQIDRKIEATNNLASMLPADTHDQIEARRKAFENMKMLEAGRDDQIRECWRLYRIASEAGFGNEFMQSYLACLPHDPDDPY